MNDAIRLGIIGYSGQSFDKQKARDIIYNAFRSFEIAHPNETIMIVSGLTAMGIPKMAYDCARFFGWMTYGIGPKSSYKYGIYKTNYSYCIGENFGDESELFLDTIDVLMKFGGGEQSAAEYNRAKELGIQCLVYFID